MLSIYVVEDRVHDILVEAAFPETFAFVCSLTDGAQWGACQFVADCISCRDVVARRRLQSAVLEVFSSDVIGWRPRFA